MDFLPVFLNLRNGKSVIVGGGEIAARKAELLTRAGANLTIVASSISQHVKSVCDPERTQFKQTDFSAEHLQDAKLVIAATDSEAINRQVSELATAQNIPVNVVDQPHLCTFIMPALVDRSPLVIAISTGGASPIFARKIKELIEIHVPARASDVAALMGQYRSIIKQKLNSFDSRLRFWEKALDSDVPELIYSGQTTAAEERLEALLASTDSNEKQQEALTGEVYLVGAGPGDPDLLTLRALRLMHKADVVLYDRLVSPAILARLRPDAEKIHVGKQRSQHPVPQEQINDMLVSYAQQGRRVLRLKGGDPFIFGRGGEELASLTEAGIAFQIVPGITAASGCAAYAGIPLTHRDYAQSVQFLPGHLKGDEADLNWEHLIAAQQTLVFYMALVNLDRICLKLIEHGMDRSTPAAVVQQGTTSNQKVIIGVLGNIAEKVLASKLRAPTITIIGEVVKLQKTLQWFDEAQSDSTSGD